MTRSVILISVILFLGTALPQAALASFWMECDVKADIEKSEQEGFYQITVNEAVVKDGHTPKGAPCLEDKTGDVLTVKIEGDDIPAGKDIALQYRYYNAMGPAGVVESETWTFRK